MATIYVPNPKAAATLADLTSKTDNGRFATAGVHISADDAGRVRLAATDTHVALSVETPEGYTNRGPASATVPAKVWKAAVKADDGVIDTETIGTIDGRFPDFRDFTPPASDCIAWIRLDADQLVPLLKSLAAFVRRRDAILGDRFAPVKLAIHRRNGPVTLTAECPDGSKVVGLIQPLCEEAVSP